MAQSIDQKLDIIIHDMGSLEERITSIEERITSIDSQHAKLSETIYTMSGQLDVVVPSFQSMNNSLDILMIGGGVTVVAGALAAVLGAAILFIKK